MPCYQVNLISLEFKGKSKEIFKKMEAQIVDDIVRVDGVLINLATGRAEATSSYAINAVKRKYSLTVVKEMAKKKIWQSQIKDQGRKITLTKW